MSKHDDVVSLRDMLNHAKEARDLLGNLQAEDLHQNRMLQLALSRLVEIIGEAANRVSTPTQKIHPDIPWPQIIGTRNRLIHGYDVIDYELLWNTINSDLPPLIATLEQILNDK
jgi:uncharacterized protein with HEPN domain